MRANGSFWITASWFGHQHCGAVPICQYRMADPSI